MLDKTKTESIPAETVTCEPIEKGVVRSAENVDGMAHVTWEPIHWCGMEVKLVTKHEIISEVNEPEINNFELDYEESGEVVSIDICLDNDELLNAFNGHYDYSINYYIERLTDCCVTNDTEFLS